MKKICYLVIFFLYAIVKFCLAVDIITPVQSIVDGITKKILEWKRTFSFTVKMRVQSIDIGRIPKRVNYNTGHQNILTNS
ncbi:hypothetical protein TorRG33x02_311850 [Trema orientale]|uniref:Uncharacterized protein n=1 Tax=Trema orientale TaxID=63057 RepID=A0A2P5BR20_TREOI|nr:hypothetical protein TorRG33x02_311850 [Trema orientale]